ncbi:MAG: hypothetical protein K8R54_09340 [Bacteroidales bacterium]|nr:hypothetical protein [Bacteroidales bacterium]
MLEDNTILLQNVSIIVGEYNDEAHQLRTSITENKYCGEVVEEFVKLNSEEKAMVWKDKLIYVN